MSTKFITMNYILYQLTSANFYYSDFATLTLFSYLLVGFCTLAGVSPRHHRATIQ